MITIDLGTIEEYDSDTNTFETYKGGVVRFEYSLKAIYDWESRWRKSFLKGDLTEQEIIDFYMTMALDPIEKMFVTAEVANVLSEYIRDSNTATTFSSHDSGNIKTNKGKIYTSEELYAMMFSSGIDLEFENRNLNRLLVILRIISSYNEPPKKMPKDEIVKQNKSLNEQRKAQMKSKG